MSKTSSWLLMACLGAALAACQKAPQVQADAAAPSDTPSEVRPAAYDPPDTPRRVRLAIKLIAARPAHLAPAAPVATEPSRDLYDKSPAPAVSTSADPPGFRITVPMCQKAERQSDPLATTTECTQLLEQAKAQAEACKQAFDNGDDKYVLSSACRQAAGFR